MKQLLPFTVFASLALISCREEAKVVPVIEIDETAEEMSALKEEIARLEERLVEQQNVQMRKDAEQAEVLGSLKGLMEELKKKSEETVVVAPLEKAEALAVDEKKEEALEKQRLASRQAAQGEELEFLETTVGDKYHDLVINRVTDMGVVFRHRGGIARVPFSQLPLAWQERFFYDRSKALDAFKNERMAQARCDKMIEDQLAKIAEDGDTDALIRSLARLEGAVAQLRAQAAVAPAQVQAPVQGGIIVNPPIIVHDDFDNRDDFFCPPVIHPPVVRTPVVRNQPLNVPTLRNGSMPRLQVPSLNDSRPLRSTTRPSSGGSGSSSVAQQPSSGGFSSSSPSRTVVRPSSRTTSPSVQRSRPTIQRSTPSVQRQPTRSSTQAVPRSRPSTPRSTPTPAPAPPRSRSTITPSTQQRRSIR